MRIDFHIDGFRRSAADDCLPAAGRVVVGDLVGGVAAMIELDHLVAGYEGLAITPSLSGRITAGSMTAIVGLNGCGKSTLLKTLAGFIPLVSGRLNWRDGRPIIGWLAQRHSLESQFPLTVQDVVSQGAWPRVSLLHGLRGEVRQRISAALERVGLLAMAKTPIEELSGGQFQRMLFARVMIQRAPLVMLDEPFTGIDEATSRDLMTLILEMHHQGQTILAVLHDNQRVAEHFPETLLLTSQHARWGETPDVLSAFNSARLA
ncbi:zinc/manganese transport system ATP-binding protein [Klebsiella oxytoca]|uniref:Zinc/manganese transport system ATP-binding protein n=1 Tax=Klebsiella oxytoca TaxID=571 RepID=A0A318FHI0_KLEOX|nr:zinc/manganese transport system ATP-binding protein [Klebsiella oxytoca]